MGAVLSENEVRLFVYGRIVESGRAPSLEETAEAFCVDKKDALRAFESLAREHILVLQPESREILMAMPFSAVPTPHTVKVGEHFWWAN